MPARRTGSAKGPPIGNPVPNQVEYDPDFENSVKGSSSEHETPKVKSGNSKRKNEQPKALARAKRRRIAEGPTLTNPLIALLGVSGDEYFEKLEEFRDVEMDYSRASDIDLSASPTVDSLGVKKETYTLVAEDGDDDTTADEEERPRLRIKVESDMDNITEDEEERPQFRKQPNNEDDDATADEEERPQMHKRVLKSNDEKRESRREITSAIEAQDGMGFKPSFSKRPTIPPPPLILDHEKDIRVPDSINYCLRSYQRDGIRFMYQRYRQRMGGILGDDMGLGKTVQVISFLSAIMKKTGKRTDLDRRCQHINRLFDEGKRLRRLGEDQSVDEHLPPPNDRWPTCLLVVPSSLISNWKNELETWGYFEFAVYQGDRRSEVVRQFRMGRLDIVLVSLEILRSPAGDALFDLGWSLTICDEVHRLKNCNRESLKAASQIECDVRIGLTGTALQNNYEELWTLLNWANPGKLGTKQQWNHSISSVLKDGQSSNATPEQTARRDAVAKGVKEKLLPMYFLRRDKQEIADQLPRKTETIAFCPLTQMQKAVYRRLLESEDMQRILRAEDSCECGSGKTCGACCCPVDKGMILSYISTFIKISNSLFLIVPVLGDSPDALVVNRKLTETLIPGVAPAQLQHAMWCEPENYCGKWKVLVGLLSDWHTENEAFQIQEGQKSVVTSQKRHKVLVFTKSRKLLDFIVSSLASLAYTTEVISGEVVQEDRQRAIDSFQTDPNVFVMVITTSTGSVGLNLTAANKVIIFDPDWNPTVDMQAMDRAYRLGQTRDVEVVRLISSGSLEELIYQRQIYKMQMMMTIYDAKPQTRYFEGVQGDKEKEGELFGVRNLFTLTEGNTEMRIEEARYRDEVWLNMAALEKRLHGSKGIDLKKSLIDDFTEGAVKKAENQMKKIEKQLRKHGVASMVSGQEVAMDSEKWSILQSRKRGRKSSADKKAQTSTPSIEWTAPMRLRKMTVAHSQDLPAGRAEMVLSD